MQITRKQGVKKRNPLVAPVMKKGVRKHKDKKRESKQQHKEE